MATPASKLEVLSLALAELKIKKEQVELQISKTNLEVAQVNLQIKQTQLQYETINNVIIEMNLSAAQELQQQHRESMNNQQQQYGTNNQEKMSGDSVGVLQRQTMTTEDIEERQMYSGTMENEQDKRERILEPGEF